MLIPTAKRSTLAASARLAPADPRGMPALCEAVSSVVREDSDRWLIRRRRWATLASAISIFDADPERVIVHVRPVDPTHCHLIAKRSWRPMSDSHLP